MNIAAKYKYSVIIGMMIVFASVLTAIQQNEKLNDQSDFSAQSYEQSIAALSTGMDTPADIIVLDAGHGGADGGAVGIGDIYEKDINLAMALKLRDILRFFGFDVIMTRESDMSIHDSGLDTIRQQKVSDMKNRLEIIKANPDCIFISIHQNKFDRSKYKGTQVFYSANNPYGQILAQCIQQSVVVNLQPENTRQIKAMGADSYIMQNSQVPSALIECGFISNQSDIDNLTNEDYQKQYCLSVLNGLFDYRKQYNGSNAM